MSTDPSPTDFTYSHTFSGDAGSNCTNHDTTATLTTNTTGTTGSTSQSVQVCVINDLSLSPGTFQDRSNGAKEYTYDFAEAGATQAFTVKNEGTVTTQTILLENNGLTPDRGFTLSGDTCAGTQLAANATCTFTITFTAPASCPSGQTINGGLTVQESQLIDVVLGVRGFCLT